MSGGCLVNGGRGSNVKGEMWQERGALRTILRKKTYVCRVPLKLSMPVRPKKTLFPQEYVGAQPKDPQISKRVVSNQGPRYRGFLPLYLRLSWP